MFPHFHRLFPLEVGRYEDDTGEPDCGYVWQEPRHWKKWSITMAFAERDENFCQIDYIHS